MCTAAMCTHARRAARLRRTSARSVNACGHRGTAAMRCRTEQRHGWLQQHPCTSNTLCRLGLLRSQGKILGSQFQGRQFATFTAPSRCWAQGSLQQRTSWPRDEPPQVCKAPDKRTCSNRCVVCFDAHSQGAAHGSAACAPGSQAWSVSAAPLLA